MRSLIEGKSVPSREQLARETWDLLLESVLKGNPCRVRQCWCVRTDHSWFLLLKVDQDLVGLRKSIKVSKMIVEMKWSHLWSTETTIEQLFPSLGDHTTHYPLVFGIGHSGETNDVWTELVLSSSVIHASKKEPLSPVIAGECLKWSFNGVCRYSMYWVCLHRLVWRCSEVQDDDNLFNSSLKRSQIQIITLHSLYMFDSINFYSLPNPHY